MHELTIDDLRVPTLGFGTWQLTGRTAYDATRAALEVGYRHVDTAQIYRNEAEVGRAIADSEVDRDEVFLTTKVWRDQAQAPDVRASTRRSLDELGVDHVDLLLLHWPSDEYAPLAETLSALTELRDAGLARAIGVSNFPSHRLAEAFDLAPIVTDQVEHHPYLAVDPIRKVLSERGGFLTAYSPIAQGRVLDDPVLREVGEQHGLSPIQVTLRWLLQTGGTVAIPRSSKPENIAANFAVWDVELSDDDMTRIAALDRGERLIDPDWIDDWD
ncbi:aldo/keto reductase [Egicoccus sp. AB-alg2]|uniref:aldo/keto reductase n=1 Tax=Egicoccus sp. AB-alg2 TaxID=3242693 RepID=UPI00359CC4C7